MLLEAIVCLVHVAGFEGDFELKVGGLPDEFFQGV